MKTDQPISEEKTPLNWQKKRIKRPNARYSAKKASRQPSASLLHGQDSSACFYLRRRNYPLTNLKKNHVEGTRQNG
jgi:hypothetical protein